MQKFGFASQNGQTAVSTSQGPGNTMAAQSSLKTKLGSLEVSPLLIPLSLIVIFC